MKMTLVQTETCKAKKRQVVPNEEKQARFIRHNCMQTQERT